MAVAHGTKAYKNPLAENRRARFDYEILDTFEAGVELLGFEAKSVKLGRMNLSGAYVIIRAGEAWLLNASIQPFQPGNAPKEYDPDRTRRLLMHQKEIKSLVGKLDRERLTLIPLKAYIKKNLVKLELGLGRSRKTKDKREVIKKRDVEREMRRDRT
jgi:SsrA-binding protein